MLSQPSDPRPPWGAVSQTPLGIIHLDDPALLDQIAQQARCGHKSRPIITQAQPDEPPRSLGCRAWWSLQDARQRHEGSLVRSAPGRRGWAAVSRRCWPSSGVHEGCEHVRPSLPEVPGLGPLRSAPGADLSPRRGQDGKSNLLRYLLISRSTRSWQADRTSPGKGVTGVQEEEQSPVAYDDLKGGSRRQLGGPDLVRGRACARESARQLRTRSLSAVGTMSRAVARRQRRLRSSRLSFRCAQRSRRLDELEPLADAAVEGSGDGLQVRHQDLKQFFCRNDRLLGVRDAEEFVQGRIEAYLAAPPVIVVLASLTPMKNQPRSISRSARSTDTEGALVIPRSRFSSEESVCHWSIGNSAKRTRISPSPCRSVPGRPADHRMAGTMFTRRIGGTVGQLRQPGVR